MDCRQARTLVHAAIDNELDLVSQLNLDEHLAECSACAHLRESLSRLHSSIGAAGLYHAAPAGLERRISERVRPGRGWDLRARLEQALRAGSVHRLGFATSVGAVVLALIVGVAVGRRSAARLPIDEIVDSHIRSLMPGHLTDEASSEHHTIKPWFAGRLDFSPVVADLSGAGFTLAGARIDYAGGRPIAALVYRRRQHVVNLFVWPSGGGPAPAEEGSRRGYNVVGGRSGSSELCAVSDLNARELREFVGLVERAH